MQQIKTAHWVETSTYSHRDGEDMTHYFVRLDPPARAWRSDYEDGWDHHVENERGHLITTSAMDHGTLNPAHAVKSADELRPDYLFTPTQSVAAPECEWQHQEVSFEGTTAVRWDRSFIDGNFRVEQAVWTESDTSLILRREHRETNLLTGEPGTQTVSESYTYNEGLPDEIFEMPSDRRIVTSEPPPVLDPLSTAEIQDIQATLDRSDKAWREADFVAFASVWEFETNELLPSEVTWRDRVTQQADVWTSWRSEIDSTRIVDFIPVAIATDAFYIKPDKIERIRVSVTVRVGWGDSSDLWEGQAEFYVRQTDSGYRIVHWEYPGEEIKDARARSG